MDRRSWPWKKKSSDKTVTATDTNDAPLPSAGGTKTDQDDAKSVKYIQITVESYAHLTELEAQVKNLNEKVSNLNEKLSSAQSEMVTKDTLVKQHAKVAEEAVSGWEKAEAEALALKQQLESVTLLKLTAENRASHLDSALKECMKQVRNVKEESEQKLHDIIFAKTKQWEKSKAELEAKIIDSEQELLRSSAEIAALSRTLQERSNLLMTISEEKSQAEAEIEVMKSDVHSCEREINSLKYELHVVSKELEIRNEEKNMSMRSAEVANKQHLEDVKKITKLEAECQRLRGLVRKKLPGPAALAQMKVEVENLGRDYGETRLRRSPAKTSPHHLSPSDFALENMQQCRKENEFLTTRLLTMEEEMKMLKEALSKRNSELQASRNICAKTANKLHSMESHFLAMNQQKSLSGSITEIPVEIESKPPSLATLSEDGIDDECSCSESWPTTLISELSHGKKEKNVDKSNKAENPTQLELMDDFLEMERLATLSADAIGNIAESSIDNPKIDSAAVQKDMDSTELPTVALLKTLVSSNADHPAHDMTSDKDDLTISKLQLRIACLFESQSQDADIGKLLEDIRRIAQDVHEELPQHPVSDVASETQSMNESCMEKENNKSTGEVAESVISFKQGANHVMVQELKDAISHIHDFVLSIGKEATKVQGRSSNGGGLTARIEEFSTSVNKVLCNEDSVSGFLLALSHIFEEKSLLNFIMPSEKCHDGDCYTSDCIDKVTLLENKVAQHEHANGKFSGACMIDSHSSSDPEIERPASGSCDLTTSHACSLEEFEQVKLQKENVETELARCKEMLELTNHQLADMEQRLTELKSQLAASEKSNSLAETQLKCMAESYNSLESQKQDLETELNLLRTKAEMLETELQDEKNSHQDDLAKYKGLQDQMERISKCSVPSDVDGDIKTPQEMEIAAATEKLAECQETIFLLGKQLNALRPPSESLSSSPHNRQQTSDGTLIDDPSASGFITGHDLLSSQHIDQIEAENFDTYMSQDSQRTGGAGNESPLNGYNSHTNPSDIESCPFPKSPLNPTLQKHRSSRSSSSSSISSSNSSLPDKHGRGFSRFFSSKGKGEH